MGSVTRPSADSFLIAWRTNVHPVGRRSAIAAPATATVVACEVAADLRLQRGGPALGVLQVRPERVHRLLQHVVLRSTAKQLSRPSTGVVLMIQTAQQCPACIELHQF